MCSYLHPDITFYTRCSRARARAVRSNGGREANTNIEKWKAGEEMGVCGLMAGFQPRVTAGATNQNPGNKSKNQWIKYETELLFFLFKERGYEFKTMRRYLQRYKDILKVFQAPHYCVLIYQLEHQFWKTCYFPTFICFQLKCCVLGLKNKTNVVKTLDLKLNK